MREDMEPMFFEPDDALKAKVRIGGAAAVRSEHIASAEKMIDDFNDSFRKTVHTDAREMLAICGRLRTPDCNTEIHLEAIYKKSRDIKDESRSLGYKTISTLAEQLIQSIERMKKPETSDIAMIERRAKAMEISCQFLTPANPDFLKAVLEEYIALAGSNSANYRRNDRLSVSLPAKVLVEDRMYGCNVLNISQGGAGVMLQRPIPRKFSGDLKISCFDGIPCQSVWGEDRIFGLLFRLTSQVLERILMGLAVFVQCSGEAVSENR